MTDPVPEHRSPPLDTPAPPGARSLRGRLGAGFDWMFRSRRTGRVTVAQLPNVALWIFLATVVLRRVVPTGTWVRTAVTWVATAALGWWALDEVMRGVNPWRRMLGLGVLGFVVAGLVSMSG